MNVDRIETYAIQERAMPENLNQAEQLLFQQFRYLYRYARTAGMKLEQGRHEKTVFLNTFRQNAFFMKRLQSANQLWNRIDSAATLFRNERTLENADKFVNAVYGTDIE